MLVQMCLGHHLGAGPAPGVNGRKDIAQESLLACVVDPQVVGEPL